MTRLTPRRRRFWALFNSSIYITDPFSDDMTARLKLAVDSIGLWLTWFYRLLQCRPESIGNACNPGSEQRDLAFQLPATGHGWFAGLGYCGCLPQSTDQVSFYPHRARAVAGLCQPGCMSRHTGKGFPGQAKLCGRSLQIIPPTIQIYS